MRLLVVGPEELYEWTESVLRAADSLGVEVRDARYSSFQTTRLRVGLERFRAPSTFVHGATHLECLHRRFRHKNTVSIAVRWQPDVTLVLKGETLEDETLSALRDNSGHLVGWWLDDPERIPEAYQRLKFYHMIFAYDRSIVRNLKRCGISKAHYLPCACDPFLFFPDGRPSVRSDLNCTIALVAAWYPEREQLVKSIAHLGMGLWGPGWKKSGISEQLLAGVLRGRKLSPHDCRSLYNHAKICPNIHHAQSRDGGLNTRTFEILAAGGFELIDHVEGIEDLLVVGREVIVYNSVPELLALSAHYLENPKERASVIANGRKRVLTDHTYANRLREIFSTLNLSF